ncbi:MAG: Asp23/Gls24 family envelope stress response protein [Oscillospiraceae bacterium]|nr:Asp23/Gls24 family envelope stress response protein [Oscillospiraceae bacterium]
MGENRETVITLEANGSLHISEDVVASIIAAAVSEVEGVTLAGAAGVPEMLGKRSHTKGVRLTLDARTVNADIAVLVSYGRPIVPLCSKVQETIFNALESMAGLIPGLINIHVSGITFTKEKK